MSDGATEPTGTLVEVRQLGPQPSWDLPWGGAWRADRAQQHRRQSGSRRVTAGESSASRRAGAEQNPGGCHVTLLWRAVATCRGWQQQGQSCVPRRPVSPDTEELWAAEPARRAAPGGGGGVRLTGLLRDGGRGEHRASCPLLGPALRRGWWASRPTG